MIEQACTFLVNTYLTLDTGIPNALWSVVQHNWQFLLETMGVELQNAFPTPASLRCKGAVKASVCGARSPHLTSPHLAIKSSCQIITGASILPKGLASRTNILFLSLLQNIPRFQETNKPKNKHKDARLGYKGPPVPAPTSSTSCHSQVLIPPLTSWAENANPPLSKRKTALKTFSTGLLPSLSTLKLQ